MSKEESSNLEQELKKEFARLMLAGTSTPLDVAMSLVNGDTGKAAWIVQHWLTDTEVLQYQIQLKDEYGEMHFLPTKADLARKVWAKLTSKYVEDKDFVQLGRLYSEIIGAMGPAEGSAGSTVNNYYTQINSSDPLEAAKEYSMIMGDN